MARKTRLPPQRNASQAPEHEGEWPILEAELEQDEKAELSAAVGLDEGLTEVPGDEDDELTPDNLIGDHRDGHWATREDEGDRGVD